ncbi:Di-copper centre-containing protein [Coniochaeta ligniaria NRRL 30616]|uniref:Di-copper centre-containing protein n=1 Tax=Coniochaeta ligniaria NRRL 30616 TaxID=1408157 RepID=A0A1J7JH22_9PEZI|nr:Di-copper centre-containing protein [Coniochaeta ligniaria NRRL 30616]
MAVSATIPTFTQAQIDSGEAIRQLSKIAYDTAMARAAKATSGCTKDKIKIRKEWRNMTLTDRKGFQEGIQCLMQKPTRYKGIAGAKTAWDDYGVLHYYQTPFVHDDATFLLWHRHYNWVLEQDLLATCGYNGTFPYWEWGLDCGTLDKSPVFDGSEYSLGGNGAFVQGHRAAIGGAKPGTGGGCVKTGPFSNYTVNVGPSDRKDPLSYNPRCLKRDLNDDVCRKWASLRNTTDIVLYASTVAVFQSGTQGEGVRGTGNKDFGSGVHIGGHYSISGDPGSDFHFSALEPGFYLHHGNIDRLHFIWQNLDWENRQTISGTNTMYNQPPTPQAVLTDNMGFEPLHRNITIKAAMDTVGGTPLCYVYEPW